jgi:GNAT superfamily N-acetyltransferase
VPCSCLPPQGPGDDVPLTTRSLDVSTWDAFVELVERNNGIYGGCWCIVHHPEYERRVSEPRALKQQLVNEGRAKAALVFDEAGVAQGWCQYGQRDELLLKHKRGYEQEPPARASWRIACIFVDKRHRRRGVARAALEGALAQIASAGGGRVEAISETTSGRAAQDRFLISATVELFEDFGFSRIRQVGKHAWIVSRTITPAWRTAPGWSDVCPRGDLNPHSP